MLNLFSTIVDGQKRDSDFQQTTCSSDVQAVVFITVPDSFFRVDTRSCRTPCALCCTRLPSDRCDNPLLGASLRGGTQVPVRLSFSRRCYSMELALGTEGTVCTCIECKTAYSQYREGRTLGNPPNILLLQPTEPNLPVNSPNTHGRWSRFR